MESSQSHSRALSTNPSLLYHRYCCHVNNAIYMGHMLGFKFHGRGLLLHDDGTTALTHHQHGNLAAHSLLFRKDSLTSLIAHPASHKSHIAIRKRKHLIAVGIGQKAEVEGKGLLISYDKAQIYELGYSRGRLRQKILLKDKRLNQMVFDQQELPIQPEHSNAMKLDLELPLGVKMETQSGGSVRIGYERQEQWHGLGFIVSIEGLMDGGSLRLTTEERGYYRRGQLSSYGERLFSNGNRYVGEFSEGRFDGQGVLVNPGDRRWVNGNFREGRLSSIIDSGDKNEAGRVHRSEAHCIRKLHQMHRQAWIDLDVELPSQYYLDHLYSEALKAEVSGVRADQEQITVEEEYRLGKIQEEFEKGTPGPISSGIVQQQMHRLYQSNSKRVPSRKQKSSNSRSRSKQASREQQSSFRINLEEVPTDHPQGSGSDQPYSLFSTTHAAKRNRQEEVMNRRNREDATYLNKLSNVLRGSPPHRPARSPPKPDTHNRNVANESERYGLPVESNARDLDPSSTPNKDFSHHKIVERT